MNKPHRNLEVWKQAMDLVTEIYRITDGFPAEERFGLCRQMRRSAVSIPSNIAEGMTRRGPKETVQFLQMALGSVSELDTQMELGKRLGFLSAAQWNEADQRLTDVDRMLAGLRNHTLRKTAARKTVNI